MIQAPNLVNPYMYAPQQQPMQPSYNAVKIDVHNPSVTAPGVAQPASPQFAAPQYATPTAPYYTYPQAQLYDYPQAVTPAPYYMPPQMTCPPCPLPAAPQAAPAAEVAQITAPAAVQATPVVQQQNINVPAVPAPQVVSAPESAAPVEVIPPVALTPQIDLNAFLAKLTDPDFEVQANVMEEIANMVKDEPQKAAELLDEKVINTLTDIINADSSKLAGPTQEQLKARQKLMAGQSLSDADKQLATTITPMEQAERNKSYSMFTTAILQKLYADEVAKLTGTTVPITELPGIVTLVDNLKDNPNPMVRISALEALSYIQQPAYKQDLSTLFTIAQNDQDVNVQEAAKAGLEKLNKMEMA